MNDPGYTKRHLLADYKKLYEELQGQVHCDYYEAYLREKKRREALEEKLKPVRIDVSAVAGFEYYNPE